VLQISNLTPFQADRAILLDKDGNQVWVVVVKATYHLDDDGTVRLHDEQEPVCHAPVYAGEPGQSSLLRESELVVDHPGTDVTLNATAYAPGGVPMTTLDVTAAVGQVTRTLRVFGDRHWTQGPLGPIKTRPRPFVEMPIRYELAFGGGSGAKRDERNPVGTGIAAGRGDAIGMPLPNVEDPNKLVRRLGSRPYPVGFGAIGADWSPRKEYGGTYDDAWQKNRLPLWPEDFDPHHLQSAHPDMVSEQPLRGGEEVWLSNLTLESRLSFSLPRVFLTVLTEFEDETVRSPVQLDRVIIEPDDRRLVMVWRSSLNCGPSARGVIKTIVDTKPYLDE
jgi:hypothetical protein